MNKDVIYIDVDDDITAISSKMRDSKEKIVALVPPKRTGVLQSVVNLRILQRVAKKAEKRLVLITNDATLLPLAAGAGIPVAKNLQSRPEVPDVPALKVDEDDDIIDGSELSVGEHADSADTKKKSADSAVAAVVAKDKLATPPENGKKPKAPKKGSQKVPNFNKFRKKLFIFGGLAILLIAFAVWAIWFAPRATVIVEARTSSEAINTSVTLAADATTNADEGVLKAIVVSEEAEASVEFEATGTREEGEAASGTLTLTNNSRSAKEVPVGTGFSNGDCTFVTRSEVSVPGAELVWVGDNPGRTPGNVDVTVRATAIGDQCNLSERSYEPTISGITARGGEMTGGSKKTLKIVTQEDVQKAAEKLAAENEEEQQAKLEAKFGEGVQVVAGSFVTERADAKVSPDVGDEAVNGKAKIASSVTYKMTGVATSELKTYLEKAIESKLSKEDGQRVYEAGDKDAEFSDFKANGKTATVSISATGQVGPQISDSDVKNRTKGKRFGDIQSDLTSIQGVDSVEVDFWPFWVSTVPDNDNRITIQFDLQRIEE